ncbi:MAG TPA: hypothetical protein VK358_09555 [Longimicrobium sp.]|nr:hypothetical protein [Longimicrobium sp.]
MSTLEHVVMEVDAPPPSTSMALVPLPRAEAAHPGAAPAEAKPSTIHRYFYGLGYVALALLLLGTWAEPANGNAAAALYLFAAFSLGVAGLGVLVHVAYRPRMDKLRKGLGAVASLALAIAATGPVGHAAREVHAQSAVVRLQPLADDLLRNGRIRMIAIPATGWIELNDFVGRMDTSDPSTSSTSVTLAEVLARDGISRLELVRMRRALEQAGVLRVEVRAAYVGFYDPGVGANLLYVRPGHVPPSPGAAVLEHTDWRTEPLGGGWYLYLDGQSE